MWQWRLEAQHLSLFLLHAWTGCWCVMLRCADIWCTHACARTHSMCVVTVLWCTVTLCVLRGAIFIRGICLLLLHNRDMTFCDSGCVIYRCDMRRIVFDAVSLVGLLSRISFSSLSRSLLSIISIYKLSIKQHYFQARMYNSNLTFCTAAVVVILNFQLSHCDSWFAHHEH